MPRYKIQEYQVIGKKKRRKIVDEIVSAENRNAAIIIAIFKHNSVHSRPVQRSELDEFSVIKV